MITPQEIRQKALKLWSSGKVLQAALQGDALFPYIISFRKPNARQQLEGFAEIRAWVEQLKHQSKETKGKGYTIHYKNISHRQLGEQRLPQSIVFETREDLLGFIVKQRDFEKLRQLANSSIACYPVLSDWIKYKPRQFMKYSEDWLSLLAVCEHFMQYPLPDCYVRELSISGIDSKFIEQHKGILSELLDTLLPVTAINDELSGDGRSRQHGFERRYGLKYPEALIRLRLLDKKHYLPSGIHDLSLPVSQLAQWPVSCERVFITENKINGLSFPEQADSIVIFGLGYGVDSLAEIDWLRDKKIIYWGDIDSHGFSILSRLRGYFPHAQALMMDDETLERFTAMCVTEPEASRCSQQLLNLTMDEQLLYSQLQQDFRRLEQERIPMDYVMRMLAALAA